MNLVLLDTEKLPDDVAIGHYLEVSGAISHDEALADSYGNELCRWHLRIAEAFAAGLKAGRNSCPRVSVCGTPNPAAGKSCAAHTSSTSTPHTCGHTHTGQPYKKPPT